MSVLSLRRRDADDATLLRRARRGDRRAHRLIARRHATRAIELVTLLVDAPAESTMLAASVLDAAMGSGTVDDDALVRSAVRILGTAGGDVGLARLVVALTDVEGRTDDTVADLIGRSTEDVAQLRTSARGALGVTESAARDCRGWALAARRDRLTVSEQEAAHGHLQLCRSCRVRLDEQRRTRDKLRLSGTAVSAVVVADVVSLSLPASGAVAGAGGIASFVLGKAGVALLGGAAVAIVGTSTGLAVARHGAPPPTHAPTLVRDDDAHATPSPSPRVAVPNTVGAGALASPSSSTRRTAPTPVPSAAVSPVLRVPLPTLSVPVTTPLPLPSRVRGVLPLPTAPTTLLPAPSLPITLPAGVVATATSLLDR